MADDEDNTQETPAEETQHAVPTEDAAEIAGSAEDAALEALQESQEHPQAESAESEEEQFEPVPGNAVPSEEATEIAGSAEDAALEAAQERAEEAVGEAVAEEIVAEAIAEEIAEEVLAEAVAEELVEEAIEEAVAEEVAEEIVAEIVAEELVEEAVEEAEAELGEETEEEEEATSRVKPAVPGAHLEVDIVPEGVDPLGRSEAYEDPYAIEGEEEPEGEADGQQEDREEVLSKPISTAAIDLASGARYRATGKRKTAVARVTLRPGSGSYLVNGRTLEEHFPRITQQRNIRQPLETVGYQERMDVVARLHGGGISAQAGALRHGVSRALLEADPNLRGELKRRGFLTRDSRAKERKKAGLKKARKKPQFSKR
jgi:small subunit ribosomal protein S9